MSNNKDKITLECIDFPVCKKVSILKDNITLYYLVQGLDIPPLYNTIKISSVTDKTDVDRKALINVASKGGRFILSMDKDISKLTYENGEDFNEKVMNESKEKSGNLNPLDIRLKTSIMVKRCNFNKSFAMKKGRLRSICVDDGKRIY
uniref:PINc domain-containing protein n=1 Tax=Parastrongyloides trichosuri TaxID=131310 RepID=A0A0N4ZFU9_PARTI